MNNINRGDMDSIYSRPQLLHTYLHTYVLLRYIQPGITVHAINDSVSVVQVVRLDLLVAVSV